MPQAEILHVGVSASYRDPYDSDHVHIDPEPESEITEESFISTGQIEHVDNQLV